MMRVRCRTVQGWGAGNSRSGYPSLCCCHELGLAQRNNNRSQVAITLSVYKWGSLRVAENYFTSNFFLVSRFWQLLEV
jgi:hypothetical protein